MLTRDDIFRMAMEADIQELPIEGNDPDYCGRWHNIERFAHLVAAAERRAWQRLTDEEIVEFADQVSDQEHSVELFARAVEARLKELNA